MKNFYDILKIGRNANQTEIKKAYLNELKKYHPDVTSFDKTYAEERAKEITEAYKILSDESAREAYDELLVNFENIAFGSSKKYETDIKQTQNDFGVKDCNQIKDDGFVEQKINVFKGARFENQFNNKNSHNTKSNGLRDFFMCFVAIFIVYSCYFLTMFDTSKMALIEFPKDVQETKQVNKSSSNYGVDNDNRELNKSVLNDTKLDIVVPNENKDKYGIENKIDAVEKDAVKQKVSQNKQTEIRDEVKSRVSKQIKETTTKKIIDYEKYKVLKIGEVYPGMLVQKNSDLCNTLGAIIDVKEKKFLSRHSVIIQYELGTVKLTKESRRVYSFKTNSRIDNRGNLLCTGEGITVENYGMDFVNMVYGKPATDSLGVAEYKILGDAKFSQLYFIYDKRKTIKEIGFNCLEIK